MHYHIESSQLLKCIVSHSRPLREKPLVGDPAPLVCTHSVVDIRPPWHVREDFEQILQFIGRQSTISVLETSTR